MGIFDKLDQFSDQIAKSVTDGIDSIMGDSPDSDTVVDAASNNSEKQEQPEKAPADDEYYKQFRTDGLVCEVEGNRGRHLFVYDDRCLIIVKPTVGSVLTGNATDGEKTIFYKDCIGIQFKESHLAIGYLQIETASDMGNNGKNNFFNENTFTFEDKNGIEGSIIKNDSVKDATQFIADKVYSLVNENKVTTNAYMRKVASFIIEKVAQYKKMDYSPADEIKKFKELLDLGAITQDEFDSKKKQLLGL